LIVASLRFAPRPLIAGWFQEGAKVRKGDLEILEYAVLGRALRAQPVDGNREKGGNIRGYSTAEGGGRGRSVGREERSDDCQERTFIGLASLVL